MIQVYHYCFCKSVDDGLNNCVFEPKSREANRERSARNNNSVSEWEEPQKEECLFTDCAGVWRGVLPARDPVHLRARAELARVQALLAPGCARRDRARSLLVSGGKRQVTK